MNLLIVRHAESMGNASGDYSTAFHDSLSPRGWEQARALAGRLRTYDFDKVIVSPLRRALETISPYLSAAGHTAEIWPEIAEGCWQDERGEPSVSWAAKPATVPDGLTGPFLFRDDKAVTPASSSFGEDLRRVHDAAALLRKWADGPASSVLMLTHGNFIRELLNLMLNTRDLQEFHHDNCGMTMLAYDNGWNLEFCNRTGP